MRGFISIFLVASCIYDLGYAMTTAQGEQGWQALEGLDDDKDYEVFLRKVLRSSYDRMWAAELAQFPEVSKVLTLLLDPKADPNECEKAVIGLLRQAYSEMPFRMDKLWFLRLHGRNLQGIASFLFWLKGSPAGLYESYRLTGNYMELFDIEHEKLNVGIDLDWERFWRSWLKVSPDKAYKLLGVKLYPFIHMLTEPLVQQYVFERRVSQNRVLPRFLQGLVEYYPTDRRLRDFIVDYPVMTGSFFDVEDKWLRQPEYAKESGASLVDLLDDYCDSVVRDPNDKLLLVAKVYGHFGASCGKALFERQMMKIAEARAGDTGLMNGLVGLAIEMRHWKALSELMKRPGYLELVKARVSELTKIHDDLEGELLQIRKIQQAL